jgi:hypothetical protein
MPVLDAVGYEAGSGLLVELVGRIADPCGIYDEVFRRPDAAVFLKLFGGRG